MTFFVALALTIAIVGWRLTYHRSLYEKEFHWLVSQVTSPTSILHDPDPVDIAYLTGGTPHVVRLILYDLWLRQVVKIEAQAPSSGTEDWARVVPGPLRPPPLDALHAHVYLGIGDGLESSKTFERLDNQVLVDLLAPSRQRLQSIGVKPPGGGGAGCVFVLGWFSLCYLVANSGQIRIGKDEAFIFSISLFLGTFFLWAIVMWLWPDKKGIRSSAYLDALTTLHTQPGAPTVVSSSSSKLALLNYALKRPISNEFAMVFHRADTGSCGACSASSCGCGG